MLNHVKTLFDEKEFFSDNFTVSLKLLKDGSLRGKITHFAPSLKLTTPFDGLYCRHKKEIDAVFFIDWSDVNLDWKVLTAFSGRIFSYKHGHSCLILKWLRITESCALPSLFCTNDFEIMFDSPAINLRNEQQKVLRLISFDVF